MRFRRLQDLPLRRKLTRVTLLTSAGALLSAILMLMVGQTYVVRATAASDLAALADNVAFNVAGPLAFNDREAAKAILESLKTHRGIRAARLLEPSGKPWVDFTLTGKTPAFGSVDSTGLRVDGTWVMVQRPIDYRGEELGSLQVTADLTSTLVRFAGFALLIGLAALIGALALAFLLARLLQRAVTDPILSLAGTAKSVATHSNYGLRAQRMGNDEVSELTDAFNNMLSEVQSRDTALRQAQQELSKQVESLRLEISERQRAEAKLAETHRELMEASRRAGQAEVATSVLHNVGNVLNSVIVSANVACERIRNLKLANLRNAGDVLQQHKTELEPIYRQNPKLEILSNYLPMLHQLLESDRANALQELEALVRNTEHIAQIVAMQQSYATSVGVKEIVPFVEIVEDAISLNAAFAAEHNVAVIRQYQDVPAFPIDKHRVLQIVTNVVKNAIRALSENVRPEERRLQITLSLIDRAKLRLAIKDNGIGIPPENLTKIFQHGFTTRRDGHGFGLHSGALAAQQLGGHLTAESEGVGKGATFVLELPVPA